MSRYEPYDPKNPWEVGDEVIFATFDAYDADTRELDGTTAAVVDIIEPNDLIRVETMYGTRLHDPYEFVKKVDSSS